MLKNATGKWPRFIGKPEPEIIFLAMEKTGCTPEETIVSGETTPEILEASAQKPEFVFDSVGDISALLQTAVQ